VNGASLPVGIGAALACDFFCELAASAPAARSIASAHAPAMAIVLERTFITLRQKQPGAAELVRRIEVPQLG
jgi:hypothetical protein